MKYNKDRVDEMLLTLMFLTTFEYVEGHGATSWKGYDWHHMDRLYQKGYISNPKTKGKTVRLSEEAVVLSEDLFKKYAI